MPTYMGSDGNDTYTGTEENDFTDGQDGDDTLDGGAGDDIIHGDDEFWHQFYGGQYGDDTLYGETGNDEMGERVTTNSSASPGTMSHRVFPLRPLGGFAAGEADEGPHRKRSATQYNGRMRPVKTRRTRDETVCAVRRNARLSPSDRAA